MQNRPQKTTIEKLLQVLAMIIIVLAGLATAKAIVIPFLLSMFLAVILYPPMRFLKNKGLPSVLALLSVLTVCLGIGALFVPLILGAVDNFQASLPVYQLNLINSTKGLAEYLSQYGIALDQKLIEEYLDPQDLLVVFGNVLTGLGNALSNTLLILLTVVFILLEASSVPKKLLKMSDDPEKFTNRFKSAVRSIQHYMAIKTWLSLATGIAVYVLLLFTETDNALLWSVLAFALNFVPNIGSLIAAVPAILITMLQFDIWNGIVVAIGYVAINFVIGNILEPRYLGSGLGLSSLVVFLSLIFWGFILGPVGMLLSVPLTMVLKIVCEYNDRTKWLAILLGDERSI